MNTPPTFANPNSAVFSLSSSSFMHKFPPFSFHHLSFNFPSLPVSPSFRIAVLIGILYAESMEKMQEK